MQQNFVRDGFSGKNFHRNMCLDFLKNSFSDEFFRHYMYLNIVLVTKYFRYWIVFLVRKTFSDEMFSSLKVFKKKIKSDF